MKFDDSGTMPLGPWRIPNLSWFACHDGVPQRDRARANGHAGHAAHDQILGPCVRQPLSPQRIAALREWIAAGGHNTPEVAEQVARRILDCGDLST